MDAAAPKTDPLDGSTPAATRSPVRRVVDLVAGRHHAIGAVGAQMVQALTSLLLQIFAVRELSADGLGVFALLYSCVVLASAVTTGLVGDSLTVLDRDDPHVRGGLQLTALVTAGLGGVLGAVITALTGLLTWPLALLLGAAISVFVLEELTRRQLMATLRFWQVVMVDGTCLLVTVAWLLGMKGLTGELVMRDLLTAILVAQAVGLVVAVMLIPAAERLWVSMRGADWRKVLHFGGWRAAQQGVRPATMALTRTLVVVAVGATFFGELEAARVYAAPTMLIVNGIGGFLFASYATKKQASLHTLIRLADRGVMFLVLITLVLGAAAVVAEPLLGDVVTGGQFALSSIAIFGWAFYAACGAVLMPYGSLAAVRGRQAMVMGMRVVEMTVSLSAVALVLWVLRADVAWTPYALAVGSLVLGLIIRQGVLAPLARREARDPAVEVAPA